MNHYYITNENLSVFKGNDPNKKTLSEIFVNFPSEIRECPVFAFSEEQKPCLKGPSKKGPSLYDANKNLKNPDVISNFCCYITTEVRNKVLYL